MSFGSVEFLVAFLPVALLLHWALPRRARVQNAALLAISYVFYASWNPKLLGILVLTTLVNLWCMRAMDARREDKPARRRVLRLSLVYNAGQLLFFKYMGFFAVSLNSMFEVVGLSGQLPVLRLVLPLGISFWTIQHVAWQIDVYYGRPKQRPTWLAFAVFSGFFPQVVSGPIPTGQELLPQFAEPRQLTAKVVAAGASAFMLGFVAKFLIADTLARAVVDPVFANPEAYSAVGTWLGLTGYALQVFGDFAGYSLIAIGIGRLFGVELPENFRYPFFSRSMIEFWRRWHITLNRFLFEHLYWPLVGSRGWWRKRMDLGFMVVFGLSGLWHGATWSFVLWGVVHGVGLAVHRRWDVFYRRLCRKDRVWVTRRKTVQYAIAAWIITQLFFVLSLIPFRAPDLGLAGRYVARMFAFDGLHHPLGGQPVLALGVLLSLALLAIYHALELPPLQRARERMLQAPAAVRGLVYGLIIVLLFIFVPVGGGTFIYAQF